jgi:hypothetical protein
LWQTFRYLRDVAENVSFNEAEAIVAETRETHDETLNICSARTLASAAGMAELWFHSLTRFNANA